MQKEEEQLDLDLQPTKPNTKCGRCKLACKKGFKSISQGAYKTELHVSNA